VFYGINLIHLSLSRQMEFNADDVAVSVAGSDALVHLLYRLNFGEQCFGLTAEELSHAAEHGLYSSDVYYHLTQAAAHLRARAKNPNLGVPPAPPAQVFDPEDTEHGPPAMWSTHPPNHEREKNAKRYYLRAPADDRSPWILFQNADTLRKKLSVAFYADFLGKRVKEVKDNLSTPQKVQAFIDAERAETSFDPKYHGLFDDRWLQIEELENLPEKPTVAQLPAFFAVFPPTDLAQRMADHKRRQEEAHMLEELQSERKATGKSFSFRGRQVPFQKLSACLKLVEKELAADQEQFGLWDRLMYAAHYRAAEILDPARARDLKRRYAFQLRVQHWILELAGHQFKMIEQLQKASEKNLNSDEVKVLVETFSKAAKLLERCHSVARETHCPEMLNVPDGHKLSAIVVDPKRPLPRIRSRSQIDGDQIQALLVCYQSTIDRLRRVYFKGLGNILARQEQIAADYLATVRSRPSG